MNKEKQIEELTQDLFRAYGINKLYSEDVAEYLYNAGYRKASDVAREIFEEIEYLIWQNDTHPASELIEDIAKLKKKYTEGRK